MKQKYKYRSNFDGYINGRACGWIFNIENPSQPVALGIYSSGTLIGSGFADIFREDLFMAGIGEGKCSFSIPMGIIQNSDDIEVRILEDDSVFPGSRKILSLPDDPTKFIFNEHRFEFYSQFKPENLIAKHNFSRLPQSNKRLSQSFSHIVSECDGVEYSGHMEWMCSRLRRGGASFFSRKRRDALDDIYWYLFECSDETKTEARYDYSSVGNLIFPKVRGMEHHTFLFDIWLHRCGKSLLDIKKDSSDMYIDFCHSLVGSNCNLPDGTGMDKYSNLSMVRDNEIVKIALPKMTKFLKSKWTLGYQELYHLDELSSYLCYLFDCCLHLRNKREIDLLGEDIVVFFSETINLTGGTVSRFALLCFVLSLQAKSLVVQNFSTITADQVNFWFENIWLASHPIHNIFQSKILSPVDCKEEFACYVVARWNSSSGLTKNAHMSVNVLIEAGLPVIKLLPDGNVYSRVELKSTAKNKLVRDFVLLHVNADDAPEALYRVSGWVDLDFAYVVGYYLWELEQVPSAHHLGVNIVDEIWVPTDFVAQAYASLAHQKVHKVGKAITVPEIKDPDRGKFGLKNDVYIFLVSFDFHSSVERKNPLAAVLAFIHAFPGRDDVCLVLKSTPYQAGHWGDPFDQWGQINDFVLSDSRIILIEEYISDDDMFELIACADVVVSPHRAEGFGYLPAYGLFYHKQVIVTSYSGTSDYCSDSCSWIVPYSLVNVPNGKFIYELPNAKWADIDVIELSKTMSKSIEETVAKSGFFAEKKFSYAELKKQYIKRLAKNKVIL